MTGGPGALGERIAKLEGQVERVETDVSKLQTDVDGLKRFQAWLFGIGSAMGALGVLVANGVKDWLRH